MFYSCLNLKKLQQEDYRSVLTALAENRDRVEMEPRGGMGCGWGAWNPFPIRVSLEAAERKGPQDAGPLNVLSESKHVSFEEGV